MVPIDVRKDDCKDIRRHQPSIVTHFPDLVEHNCAPKFQAKGFNINGIAFACNMDHGLIPQFNHIMGFFAEMAERGCDVRMNELSFLAVLDLSKTAGMILDMQNECGMPFVDNNDWEVLPKPVLSVLIVKADVDQVDCSFFSAFCLAFRELMCNDDLVDNNGRVNCCVRVVANIGKSHPMHRHVISPCKGKRRPSV